MAKAPAGDGVWKNTDGQRTFSWIKLPQLESHCGLGLLSLDLSKAFDRAHGPTLRMAL